MIALLRRLSPLLAMAALAYMAHGALEGEPVSLADDGSDEQDVGELLPFAMEVGELRRADERPPAVREPFGVVTRARAVGPEGDEGEEEDVYLAPPPPTTTRPFELRLESVVDWGKGLGTARIGGRTVAVGESLPGLDPGAPPTLLAVEGPSALVEHRGILHLLDLRKRPSVFVPSLPLDFGLPSPAVDGGQAGSGAGAGEEAGADAGEADANDRRLP